MASKIVEIHRAPGFIQNSNPDPEVQEYFSMAFKAIGSYWKEMGTMYASGLTRLEEDVLLPEVIGNIDPVKESRDFRQKVQDFYMNINTKVSPDGLKLEIGLEGEGNDIFRRNDKGEIVKDNSGMPVMGNKPLRIMDYIRYKHIIGHPHVASTLDEALRYQHKQFYVVDKVADTISKSKLRDKEDLAQREYLSINKDMQKVEMVLTLLGVNTRGMGVDSLLLELKEQASIDPDAAESVNTERLERFVRVVNDKELAAKYDIMEMVRANLMERVKTKVLIKESGETIGEDLKEAVIWLLDKKNSQQVNSLYANLDAIGKDRRVKHASPHLSDTKKRVATEPIE